VDNAILLTKREAEEHDTAGSTEAVPAEAAAAIEAALAAARTEERAEPVAGGGLLASLQL